MAKNMFSNNRFWLVSFLLLSASMLAMTLYPYNFSPPANGTEWLVNEPGIYFNGGGIAYTDKGPISPNNQVSVELWLQERPGSKNWGPRDIFSFYDGKASPPLLIGQWNGRIFLYSRFESNRDQKWYTFFQSKERFQRGKPHLVTVTFGDGEKAIYIDGELANKRSMKAPHTADIKISGRLVIGNSPLNREGWQGEMRGLAVYDRVLSPTEIKRHSAEVSSQGMGVLAEAPGCQWLYTFEEGNGNTIKNMTGGYRPFNILSRMYSLPETIFHLPYEDMRIDSLSGAFATKDFWSNILFFLPYGALLSLMLLRKYHFSCFSSFAIVITACGIFSFTMEFAQLFLPTRVPTMLDILSNMVGGGLGFSVPYFFTLRHG